MGFEVKIIADSLAPNGKRLTTLTATYPRFIHSEILTHRDRARNSASSRAIPWPKMVVAINENPVIPIRFGSEQKGMQTGAEVDNPALAEKIWLQARDAAVMYAEQLAELGVHKSICNRVTEPWMWMTVLMTATEWNNFFRLRCHQDAEIHFQKIAGMMREALQASAPVPKILAGDHSRGWHLPFIDLAGEDMPKLVAWHRENCSRDTDASLLELTRMVSVARCARVSYLTHDGKRDIGEDFKLYQRLVQGSGFGHWSPHEHVAMCAAEATTRSGPFFGWLQYRKGFAEENAAG